MTTVVGVFTASEAAQRAASDLEALGLRRDRVTVLFPGEHERLHAEVGATSGEPPGVGTALGGVVGGATGASAGVQAGALVGVFVPGIGPVFALGALGAILLGAAGAAVGRAFDNAPEGLSKDELFVYEELLGQGRALVIALSDDEAQAELIRQRLARAGAESLDAARDRWWLGLREAEAHSYTAAGGDFARDEADYRLGFEAALAIGRGAAYDETVSELRSRYPAACAREAFRRGYEGGLRHAATRRDTRRVA
jgi:hypothetical protein